MEYFEPKTLGEATDILARYGEEARVIAGGTDVLVDMKFKEEPKCLVNIKRIPDLSYIKEDQECVRIGPLTTVREIETNRTVKERFPVLWDASHQFASLQIRNTATIGGNICRASPSGEMLTPLLVLEAMATIALQEGEQKVLTDSLFLGPGKTVLGNRGLLKEIEIPYPPKESRGIYLKHAIRGAMDIAIVGVAILVVPDSKAGVIREAKIGLAAVAPTPIRAKKAEAMLQGKVLERGLIQEAARQAAEESRPITDHRGSASYRKLIVQALTQRGLEEAWKTATGKEVS